MSYVSRDPETNDLTGVFAVPQTGPDVYASEWLEDDDPEVVAYLAWLNSGCDPWPFHYEPPQN